MNRVNMEIVARSVWVVVSAQSAVVLADVIERDGWGDTATGSANSMVNTCAGLLNDPNDPNQGFKNGGNSFTARCGQIWNYHIEKGKIVFDATEASQNNAINQQAPQQVSAQGTQATRLTAAQLGQMQGAIDTRMNTLFARLAPAGQNALLAGSANYGMTGGAASADSLGDSLNIGPVGVWFNSSYNTGAISGNSQQLGYDFGNWGFTFGADYKPIDRLAVGTAFAYGNNQSTFASIPGSVNSLGTTENNIYTGMIYAA